MPHGLCLVDGKGQVVVCNKRLRLARERYASGPAGTRPHRTSRPPPGPCQASINVWRWRSEPIGGPADGEVLIDTEHRRRSPSSSIRWRKAAPLFEGVTDRQIAEAKIHQLTRFDTLTGVPNRAFLHDQTEAALAALKRRGPFAILFVELDDLTQVNDTLGHTCGDALLCAVADRFAVSYAGPMWSRDSAARSPPLPLPPLAPSRARHGTAGRVHSDCRGNGSDRQDRQAGPAQGLHRMRKLAHRRARRGQSIGPTVSAR